MKKSPDSSFALNKRKLQNIQLGNGIITNKSVRHQNLDEKAQQ